MIMCLIHDIVEIDAGDTYAYDEEGKKTQEDREEKAADRIFSLLPEDQAKDLRAIFEEFQERRTPEARFARAMDNLEFELGLVYDLLQVHYMLHLLIIQYDLIQKIYQKFQLVNYHKLYHL